MSDSVWPRRQQTTRLPYPWDSTGKNTGVGCHFLLQCVKMTSESEATQSCPAHSDSMDCSLPGSSVHGIFQARVPEWVAIAFSAFNHKYCIRCKNWTGTLSDVLLGNIQLPCFAILCKGLWTAGIHRFCPFPRPCQMGWLWCLRFTVG